MYTVMSSEEGDRRLPVRIDKETKLLARGVAALRGLNLSALVKSLLKEAYNEERKIRPQLLDEEILKIKKTDEQKIKRPVAVRSPANLPDQAHGKKKPPHPHKASERQIARKR